MQEIIGMTKPYKIEFGAKAFQNRETIEKNIMRLTLTIGIRKEAIKSYLSSIHNEEKWISATEDAIIEC
jgi:hypothetical protein